MISPRTPKSSSTLSSMRAFSVSRSASTASPIVGPDSCNRLSGGNCETSPSGKGACDAVSRRLPAGVPGFVRTSIAATVAAGAVTAAATGAIDGGCSGNNGGSDDGAGGAVRAVEAVGPAQDVPACCTRTGASATALRENRDGIRGSDGRGTRLKPLASPIRAYRTLKPAARRSNWPRSDSSAISRANAQSPSKVAKPAVTLNVRPAAKPIGAKFSIKCPRVTAPTAPPAPSGS